MTFYMDIFKKTEKSQRIDKRRGHLILLFSLFCLCMHSSSSIDLLFYLFIKETSFVVEKTKLKETKDT